MSSNYFDEDVEHDEVLPGVVEDGLLHRALPRRAVRDGVAAERRFIRVAYSVT